MVQIERYINHLHCEKCTYGVRKCCQTVGWKESLPSHQQQMQLHYFEIHQKITLARCSCQLTVYDIKILFFCRKSRPSSSGPTALQPTATLPTRSGPCSLPSPPPTSGSPSTSRLQRPPSTSRRRPEKKFRSKIDPAMKLLFASVRSKLGFLQKVPI